MLSMVRLLMDMRISSELVVSKSMGSRGGVKLVLRVGLGRGGVGFEGGVCLGGVMEERGDGVMELRVVVLGSCAIIALSEVSSALIMVIACCRDTTICLSCWISSVVDDADASGLLVIGLGGGGGGGVRVVVVVVREEEASGSWPLTALA